jgi:acyl-CoA synthetase (AMP-forming)/AMP-acid ligase II
LCVEILTSSPRTRPSRESPSSRGRSERWGELVHAIVVPERGAKLDAEAIVEHCRPRIAGFKLPRSAEFRDDPLPKSGAGKVLKSRLRAQSGEPLSEAP